MSAALVRLQRKGQMVIPRALREEAGIAEGTLMKVAVIDGGQFLLTPQVTIDRRIVTERSNKGRKAVLRDLAQVVAELRQEAKAKRIDKMSTREINAAVSAARQDRRKTGRRPVR